MKKQKSDKFYRFTYRLFYPIFRIISRKKYGIKGVKAKKYKEPILVLCNHTTDLDFVCVASYIKNHMFYVCSQHVLGMGLKGKMLKNWFNPIAVYKGSKKQKEVMDILRRIKKGNSILMFPEGKISHDGLSSKLDASIGKLIKTAKCKVITFRTEGGFFMQPRWQNYSNKGKLFSHGIVGEYTVDFIASKSPEELADIVNNDLFVDAYAVQENKKYKYKLKKGVLDVTRYYSVCPHCLSVGKLTSTEQEISCECGYKLTLDKNFYLNESAFTTNNAVKTFKDWNILQQKVLKEQFDKNLTISATDITLNEVGEAHKSRRVCIGELTANQKGFTVGDLQFDYAKIEGLEVLSGGRSLVFCFDGIHYELISQTNSLVTFLEYYNFSIV